MTIYSSTTGSSGLWLNETILLGREHKKLTCDWGQQKNPVGQMENYT